MEAYVAQAKSDKEIIFVVGLMRKVARHPKTAFATNYLDILQKILVASAHSQSLKDVVLSCIADMVNNQSLEFYPTYRILIRAMPPLDGKGWHRLLDSCK